MHDVENHGCVAQPVKTILRVEAALILIALVFAYWKLHASWVLFAVFLLAPDLLMIGYLKDTRLGAWCYNAAHSYVGPLIAAALFLVQPWFAIVAVIWGAHIAFDRALGYGLKYPDSFQHTHLGMIGREK